MRDSYLGVDGIKIREDLTEVLDGPNAVYKSYVGLRYFFGDGDRYSVLKAIGAAILIGIFFIFVYPGHLIFQIFGIESPNLLLILIGIIGFLVGIYLVGIIGYYIYISD